MSTQIHITEEQLNDNERAVLRVLRGADGQALHLDEISARAFAGAPDAYLRTKNAVRRPVKAGLAHWAGPGFYAAQRRCAHVRCGKPVTGLRRYCGPSCRGRASEARAAEGTVQR